MTAREFPVTVGFSARWPYRAGAVLAACAVGFVACSAMPFGAASVAAYAALSLALAAACAVRIRVSDAARPNVLFFATIATPLAMFWMVDMMNGCESWMYPDVYTANWLCWSMVLAAALAVTGRLWSAVAAGGAVAWVFGVANCFVVRFRGRPIVPWDLGSAATAAEVAGGYDFRPSLAMAAGAVAWICWSVLFFKLWSGGPPRSVRRSMAARGAGLVTAVLIVVLLLPLNVMSAMGLFVWSWNQLESSRGFGVAANFVGNLQFVMVDEPDGYSPDAVREAAIWAAGLPDPEPFGDPETVPDIFVVMNESFADFSVQDVMRPEHDVLPNLHAIQDSGDVVWGTSYASVYGGDTCNSEWEFLTGNTMAFLPADSKPYQQYVDGASPALPWHLKSLGYSCSAIHPGAKEAWDRDEAYPRLGFDRFLSVGGFYVDLDMIRGFVTDRCCYEQALAERDRIHEDGEGPAFVFTVTIQNHGGYMALDEVGWAYDYNGTVPIDAHPGVFPQAERYLSLAEKSDQDLAWFLDRLSESSRPTVVLFFGDHWPYLDEGIDGLMFGDERNMARYGTPFFLWANYPLDGTEFGPAGMNRLSSLLLRAAGLEQTPYMKLLDRLGQDVPALTARGAVLSDGTYLVPARGFSDGTKELVDRYAMLQYAGVFRQEDIPEGAFGGFVGVPEHRDKYEKPSG